VIQNMNDYIIDLESQLSISPLNKKLLIQEAFALWYILLEDIECENFSEQALEKLLKKNYNNYKDHFSNDADYNFIIGWMMCVAFWYFDSKANENEGYLLLMKAYKSNPKNSFFKWAVRDQISLTNKEIEFLKTYISIRFEQFYDYGNLINEYFMGLIQSARSI